MKNKMPAKPRRRPFRLSPSQIILVSFAAMILAGTLLLCLPFASRDGRGVGFLRALFTATSACCVTGLVVVNTAAHWTLFGKVVILALIQLGALGFITVMTLSMVLLRRRISLRDRLVIQAAFNQSGVGGMVRFIKSVVAVTLAAEAAGAILLAAAFYAGGGLPLARAAAYGVFHSVSAFCNAGFDIIGPESLTPYQGSWFVNLVVMALIIAGGLGFTVWGDLILAHQKRKAHGLRYRLRRLSLHTKLALGVTAVLTALGIVLFLLLEWGNPDTLGGLHAGKKLLAASFQSVTLRTAGFNTISQAGLTDFSKLVSSLLMLIGGSPAGTAGGVKTVTVAVVVVAMLSAMRGRSRMEVLGRTLPPELLQKALTVICAMFFVVSGAVFTLHFSEAGSAFKHDILDLVFEVASGAGTVGVTTGITPHLSAVGMAVLILCMFLGRLGPVTVVVALNMRLRANGGSIALPDENVIIG